MDSERLQLGDVQFSVENKARVHASLARNTSLYSIRMPQCNWTDRTTDSLCKLLDENKPLALWLDKATFGDHALVNLCKEITKNGTLEQLMLPNCRLNDEMAPALCTLLQHNHTLDRLRLDKADFSAYELISLCEAMSSNRTLISLDLTETSWTLASTAALCRFLQKKTPLEILQLKEARFTPEHIISLCEALGQNQSLKYLDLSNTTWSDASVETLCHYVSINTSLETLMLREAKISPDMMTKLLASLSRNHKLRILDLSHSTWGEGSLTSLHECISQNHTLQLLHFSFSTFTDAGLSRLFGSLSKNNVLKNVNFHQSTLTDVGADAISVFLLRNSQVEELWFGTSQFTDRGVVDLMSSLSANETMVDLTFSLSVLSDAAIPDICRMLQDNKHIKQIKFNLSKFTDLGVSRLMKTLAKTKTLQSLNIMQDDLTDEVIAALCSFLDQNATIQTLGGTDVTDSKLRWALQQLVKLQNVQEATLYGGIMAMDVKFYGQTRTTRITADAAWQLDIEQTQDRLQMEPSLEIHEVNPANRSPAGGAAAAVHQAPGGEVKKVKKPWYRAVTSIFKGKKGVPSAKEQPISPQQQQQQQADPSSTIHQSSALQTSPLQSDVPAELYLLDEEYVQAYKDACAGGTQQVYQCRVMLVGHEGAGKTSIKNTLLGQPFQHQHHITNGLEIEVNKTKDWSPLPAEDEYAERIASYIIKAIKVQEEVERPESPSPTPPVMSSAAPHESLMPADEEESDMLPDSDSGVDEPSGAASPYMSAKQADRHPAGRAVQEDIHLPEKANNDATPQDDGGQLHAIPPNIVEILKRQLKNKKTTGKDDVSVDLFFWDSGGQGIFYNTTKTFLSRRCIYLLALDMAKSLHDPVPTLRKNWRGDDVKDTGCPQTVKGHLEYWLKCLHTFVPGNDQNSSPNVVIVGTHKDACTAEEVEAFYKDILEFIKNKKYENDVRAIVSLSNSSRDDNDVCKLKDLITDLAEQHSYLLPLSWFVYKDELLKSCQAPVPRMTLDQAIQLGLQHGMSGETDVKAALSFFSEVGDILFFDEPTLHNFIIGQPQWLINKFREVLTVPSFHEQRVFHNSRRHFRRLDEEGILHEEVLRHVWPDEAREELITLMKRFALILPMPAGYSYGATEEKDGAIRYLVPCLLPLADPDTEKEDISTAIPALTLLPPDGFLPVGLTSRLFTGLVNEDGWKVVEQIYGDSSTFLPKGNNSSIQMNIRQRQDVIEIHGKELFGTTSNGDLHDCLKIILDRLEAITSTICPLRNFNIGMHCPCCYSEGIESMIRLGYRGEERKSFMYCKIHRDKCSTSGVIIWFKDVVCGSVPGSNTEGLDVDVMKILAMTESTTRELQKDRARLVGASGLGVFAESAYNLARIRSLGVIQEDDVQIIEAEKTRGRKADMLIKYLLPCSSANLLLFMWILVKANQAHQLPQSIPPELKTWLAERQKDDILKVAQNM